MVRDPSLSSVATSRAESATAKPPRLPDYELIRRIGRGSYGEVWLARNVIGAYRAIKIVRRQEFENARPFEREFFGIQRFEPISRTHPGLVSILHIGQNSEAGYFFYVMELADDPVTGQQIAPENYIPKTLASELSHLGRLPPRQCVNIGLLLTSALAHLHRHGLIHRDIKPSNIIFINNLPKFADIGLVTNIGEAVSFIGTEGYVPKEGPGQPEADVFGLGKVLYQMTTGKSLEEFPSLPTNLRDEGDAPQVMGLNEVIVKACQPEPRQRFHSANEMHQALQYLQCGKEETTEITQTDIKSVAVLPFVNMNADEENEFLSDGITEDLIAALTHVKGLRVAGRTSAFAFKGKSEDLRKIAEQLGVTAIVEGSVRKSGKRLRITAQLIKAADGYNLWSERYDRQMKDVFALQDEISRAIVEALKVQLAGEPQTRWAKRRSASPEAYELYLKGRYFWNQRAEGLEKALRYFELALLEDREYALAYTGVADSFNLLGFYGYLRPKEAFPKAKAAALKALALNEGLAEAHNSLGFSLLIYDWDRPGADQAFARALELNPNYVPARYWRASHWSATGRHAEAIGEVSRALEIDPLSVFVNMHVGWTFFHARQYHLAEQHLRKALELEPKFLMGHWLMGRLHSAQGKYDQAIAELQKGISISPTSTWALAWLGHTLGVAGRRQEALKVLASFQQRSQKEYIRSYLLAMIHVGLGEVDLAFRCLEKAAEEPDVWMAWLKCDPIYDPLHADPRFADLTHRLGLDSAVSPQNRRMAEDRQTTTT